VIEVPKETLHLASTQAARALFANDDDNLIVIGKSLNVKLISRGNFIKIIGEAESIKRTKKFFDELTRLQNSGKTIERADVIYVLSNITSHAQSDDTAQVKAGAIRVAARKNMIFPKSKNQADYIEAVNKYDIVFAIGPAGTGKTYLAMAMAVAALLDDSVRRVVLTRPAVEAGESLGFLPGDLAEKLNPYLRPLYDALYEMIEIDKIQRYLERGIIEVAPLAYMRGRTLNDSFIVLDEAQNTTKEQMKMLLTRLGFNSKLIVTGDVTQVDLPPHKLSGLVHAQSILKNIRGIKIMNFSEKDVVRHALVKKIILAYQDNGRHALKEVAKQGRGLKSRRSLVNEQDAEDISAT